MRGNALRGARDVVRRLLPSVCGLLLSAALALTPAQEARAHRLGTNLRCPICQGVPITESPNDISREMLREVRQQVVAGRSDREVYAYFAARYGNRVLLDPPKEGSNLVLWGAPLVALAAGGAVLRRFLRGGRAAAPGGGEEPFDPYLAEVQRRARPEEERT